MDQQIHVKYPHAIQTLRSIAQASVVTAARLTYQAEYGLQIYFQIIHVVEM